MTTTEQWHAEDRRRVPAGPVTRSGSGHDVAAGRPSRPDDGRPAGAATSRQTARTAAWIGRRRTLARIVAAAIAAFFIAIALDGLIVVIVDPGLLSDAGRAPRFWQVWSSDVALFVATWIAMTIWSLASGFME